MIQDKKISILCNLFHGIQLNLYVLTFFRQLYEIQKSEVSKQVRLSFGLLFGPILSRRL
jgi:hypothetical protein